MPLQPLPIQLDHFTIGSGHPLCIIAGPCVIESLEHALHIALHLREMCRAYSLNFIFKASFDKANRSHHDSYRGPGIERGLQILQAVRTSLNVAVTTDIHLPEQAALVAQVCDLIQIPALLSRQTDLLRAAAETGRPINIKKGQFAAPWEMRAVVQKVLAAGNPCAMLTERGSSFGYQYLINDLRSLPIMRQFASGVCFDVSHSLQLPGIGGATSGGQPEFLHHLARGAVAVGCDALFIEVHNDPESAKSDAATVCSLAKLPKLLQQCQVIHELISQNDEGKL